MSSIGYYFKETLSTSTISNFALTSSRDPLLIILFFELREYLDSVAVEVNEILQEKGQLTIGEICQRFALPAENVQQLVEENIHRRIHAHVDAADKSQLYTESFVLRQKVLVRGLLNAITRPTLLSSIQSQTGIPDRLFASELLFD